MPFARFRRALPVTLLLVLSVPLATPRGCRSRCPRGSRSGWSRPSPPCCSPARSPPRPTARCSSPRTRWTRSARYEAPTAAILLFRDGKDPVVFAEGFRAIFGMAWHDGTLYVMHMPFLTVLRDTDGDGKADDRKDLFKDLGPTDNRGLNDHIVSGLQFGMDGYLYISVGDKGVPKATGPDGRTIQIIGGGIAPMPARRHRDRGRLLRHAQPPRAEPRRPRQPLHLRQHRRRPRLVDPGHPPHRRRLLRLSLRLPRLHGPDAPPDGRVRRRLPLRRRSSTRRTRGPRSIAAVGFWAEWGKRQGPGVPVRPRGRDVQGRRDVRLRRARRRERLPADRPGPLLRRPDPLRRRLEHGRLGQQDREGRPGLRRHLHGRESRPARGAATRTRSRPRSRSSTTPRSTSGCGRRPR